MNIVIAGVGGQGTVLASKITAYAALAKGLPVRTAETIGMAQRGGSVLSHIKIGESYSPLVSAGTADLIIGFELAEAARALPYLSENGAVLTCDISQNPAGGSYASSSVAAFLEASAPRVRILDGAALLKGVAARTLNVAMLGAASSIGWLPFSIDELKEAISSILPEKLWEMNFISLDLYNKLFV